jgi:hypothetical protein
MMIRNEKANETYTTDFMCSLFEEEGGDLFDVRQAILGHIQQGGNPTPFDRIMATRLASKCINFLEESVGRSEPVSASIGLENGKIGFTTLIELADGNDNVTRAIIGNETLLTEEWTLTELAAVLDRMRTELDVPVGTAEPWHVWIANPTLAEHVDFIAVHLLPYWEGVHIDAAVAHVAARMRELQARFPDKPIVIGEVGWPRWGRSRGDAVASLRNAAAFARRFLAHAETNRYDY